MKKYIILANPGHNRIYFNTALKIAESELRAMAAPHNMGIDEIKEGEMGLPASISFTTSKELSKEDFQVLSQTSIYYALFEVVDNNLLKPICVPDFHTFPESMVQILKYTGKTNEQFTRLMVNIALSACKTNSKKITLLDPMCGKGTTLYEGFIRGFDVIGVEINNKWTQEIENYVVRYLKEGKYKHKAQKGKVTGAGKKKLASLFEVKAAADKQDFKDGNVQSFKLFNGDTTMSNSIVKKKSCDILISDLPYGVQHGSKNEKGVKVSRSPLDLLKKAIPAWHEILKTNGSAVIAYNEFTMKYDDVAEVFEENGFKVLNEAPYNDFLHRVDQSINRNVIVAIKK